VRKVDNNLITVDPAGGELVLMSGGLEWGWQAQRSRDFDRAKRT